MKRFLNFFKGILLVVGASTLGFWLLIMIGLTQVKSSKPEMPAHNVLVLDLNTPILAKPTQDPLTAFLEPGLDLFTLTETIRRAADDPRIHGLIADVRFAKLSPSMTEEIFVALQAFNASGKYSAAFADTFSEGGNAMGRYYLASGFSQVWVQPTGGLDLLGFNIDIPFFKQAFEKFGITPQFEQRKAYKTAVNQLTEDQFTPAHKEQINDLYQGIMAHMGQQLATNRPKAAPLEALIAQAIFTPEKAMSAGLIDAIGYWDELEEHAESVAIAHIQSTKAKTADITFTDLASYRSYLAQNPGNDIKPEHADQGIALIYAVGPIMRGHMPEEFGAADDGVVYADSLAQNIATALENEKVKAIVLRVDSPGGSYTASDTVRHALLKAKQAGKKLIVSMGTAAASGGYYIAMDADEIYANPSTITGSIGVFGGKFVIRDMTEKLGVTWDSASIGSYAGMWSAAQPFSQQQRAAFANSIDRVYADFTQKVASLRDIPADQIDDLAGGRVYTGQQALNVTLIDNIGSLRQAIEAAKKSMGLSADIAVPLYIYPRTHFDLHDFLEKIVTGGMHMRDMSWLGRMHTYWRMSQQTNMFALEPLAIH